MAARRTSKPEPETSLVPAGGTDVPPLKPREVEAERRIAGLKRRIDMIADCDAGIVSAVQKFRDIPGPAEPGYAEIIRVLNEGTADELASWGFPGGVARGRRNLRLALWGQRPKKDAPFGIISANERHQTRMKIAGKQGNRSTFNLTMVNIPAPKPQGPEDRVVIVQPKEKT